MDQAGRSRECVKKGPASSAFGVSGKKRGRPRMDVDVESTSEVGRPCRLKPFMIVPDGEMDETRLER